MDRNVDWKCHIKALSSKISGAIDFLKHAKSFLPQYTLKTLYTGIVEPHILDFAALFGDNCGAIGKNQLQSFKIERQGY